MAGQYAALLSNGAGFAPLLEDSFALPAAAGGGNAAADARPPAARARWTEAERRSLLDGARWNLSAAAPPGLDPGAYALYADVDVQVRRSRISGFLPCSETAV